MKNEKSGKDINVTTKKTNFERIKNMNFEKLEGFLCGKMDCDICAIRFGRKVNLDETHQCHNSKDSIIGIWLKSEVEEWTI